MIGPVGCLIIPVTVSIMKNMLISKAMNHVTKQQQIAENKSTSTSVHLFLAKVHEQVCAPAPICLIAKVEKVKVHEM